MMVELDPGLKYPREVPRDQNFFVKILIISSTNDVILCILWIYVVQIVEKQEKALIFACFAY